MFTKTINTSPLNLLKSVHFLNQCALFPQHQTTSPYFLLTKYPSYKADFVLAINPTKTSSSISTDLVAKQSNTIETPFAGFVSGWLGIIDYPQTLQVQPKSELLYYPYSILIDSNNRDFCILQSPNPIDSALINEITATLNNAIEIQKRATQKIQSRHWEQVWSKGQYDKAFDTVKEYLVSGDTYQINLAMPFKCSDDLTNISPLPLLSKFNGRHACYIKLKSRTIFSVSPERLLHINGQSLITSPIKGTAARSSNELDDRTNAEELVASVKNRAENLMIVDLLRNDLSVHALPHSVKVEKLFELESHHNVHHLVSTIIATLKPGTPIKSALLDTFPGGSITGAPKKRAMEIINEIEAEARGAYCGSFGYIDDRGNCDFNILIRTIEAKKEGAACWGGGGIVIDSECDSEYQEIFNKIGQILTTPL